MAEIGLLGGSFDPVHEGHLNLARAALECGAVERVFFLPSGVPPHKRGALVPARERLDMIRLAIEGRPGMDVCLEELGRPGISYTADTLCALKARFPGDAFSLLLGADALLRLRRWRRVDEVIRLSGLLVMMREGVDETRVRAEMALWRERGAQIGLLDGRLCGISSTEIRQKIRRGEPLDGLVAPKVEAYLRVRGLYQREQGESCADETGKDGL